MDNILHANIEHCTSCLHHVFPSSLPSDDERSSVIGGYLNGGKLCWLAQDAKLTIIYHGTKRKLSYKKFENILDKNISLKIIACKEYGELLVVGLQSEDEKGFLCLFDPKGSKVMKMIEIPYSISCLEVLLLEGGATHTSKNFSQSLRWLFGVVAVGTEQGHLYLIDLRLDDKHGLREFASTIETVPTVVRDVPKLRVGIYQRNAHLAFDVLDQCHENEKFHFVAPDDEIIETFETEDISVTSLYFEPRCTSLFIGFSFGQFQIFDLHDLTLSFSSEIFDGELPISHFVFQEPENDPKNFCYLWAVRSYADEALNKSCIPGTMFQLVYRKKEILESLHSISSSYSELESCAVRFDISLDPSLGISPANGISRILQCCAIENHLSPNRIYQEDEYCSTPSSSVFIAAIETLDATKQSIHLVIFDINSWYVAHMPNTYRGFVEDQDYLAVWDLSSLVETGNDATLALYTVPSSLHHFRSKIHPAPVQFTRPSAYSLKTNCLSQSTTQTCFMPGVQMQAIQHMLDHSTECLVDPSSIVDELISVGLIDQTNSSVVTLDRKRESILSSALDHGNYGFLSRVIHDLASGEHAASGCTLRFIMEWAWKTIAIIKDSIDAICGRIFDCSIVVLDAGAQSLLSRHTSELSDLFLVLKALFREAEDSSEYSKLELDVKMNVVKLIQDYLKILRWFIGARLLPEQLEGYLSSELATYEGFHFVYKQNTLKRIFENRRKDLKRINSSSETSLLIIDGLVEEAGENLLGRWKKMNDNSSASYPPPSLMALLDIYYLENIDESLKHTIVTYFLLDILAVAESSEEGGNLSELYTATYEEHRQAISYFPQTFQLPPSTTKLIKAFWMLDHKQFQDSVSTFCEAGTDRVSSPWQHRRILQAYMLQGHPDLSLQFLHTQRPNRTSSEDVKLHIEVYVKNGLTHHALDLARSKADSRSKDLIFSHLLSCCFEQGLLHNLLNITISPQEDSLVTTYLQSSNIPHAREMLILHHLRRFRYVQAIQLYKQNKHSAIMTENSEMRQHATLGHIIQGYINVLPKNQRELALTNRTVFEKNVYIRKEVLRSQPLSAVLNSRRKNAPLSRAALLSLTLNKPKEVAMSLPMTPFRRRPASSEANHCKSGRLFSEDVCSSESAFKSPRKSRSRRSFSRMSIGDAIDSPASRSIKGLQQLSSPLFFPDNKEMNERRCTLMQKASVLLQTPPINRQQPTPKTSQSNFDLMTPQSILKVKLLKGKSPSLPDISQTQPSSRSIPMVESGSLTSLATNKSESRKLLNDDGLDSSGSECETPHWMKPSVVTSESGDVISPKFNFTIDPTFAIDTPPVEEILKNLKGVIAKDLKKVKVKPNPAFDIDTPPVKELLKNFKRIGKEDIEKASSERSCQGTPKRLRFFGLNTSADDEVGDAPVMQLPPLDNIVLCQRTDEGSDVDVTGDFIPPETWEEPELSVANQRNADYLGAISSDNAEVIVEGSQIVAIDHVNRDVNSIIEDSSEKTPAELVVSDDAIMLRISDSSGDFLEATEMIESLDDDGNVLEISSDEETATQQKVEENTFGFLHSSSAHTQQSTADDTMKNTTETRYENPVEEDSTPYQSFQNEDDVPYAEPPKLPEEAPVKVIHTGLMQETNLSVEVESSTTNVVASSSNILTPSNEDVFVDATPHYENAAEDKLTFSDDPKFSIPIPTTELGIAESKAFSLDQASVENEARSVEQSCLTDVGRPEPPAPSKAEGVYAKVSMEDKEVSPEEELLLESSEVLTHKEQEVASQQFEKYPEVPEDIEFHLINQVLVKGEEILSDSTGVEITKAPLNTLPVLQEVEENRNNTVMQHISSSHIPLELTIESTLPDTIFADEEACEKSEKSENSPSAREIKVQSRDEEEGVIPVAEPEVDITISTNKLKTPAKVAFTEPVFILSPPATRSGRKRRPPAKLDSSPPKFLFSPPSTIRTRSQRKRKQNDTGDEAKLLRRSSPRLLSQLSSKPPLSASARKASKSPSRKSRQTPTRSSLRSNTKPMSTSEEDLTDHTSEVDPTSLQKTSMKKTPSRRSTRQRKESTTSREDESESTNVDDEVPTVSTRSSQRNPRKIRRLEEESLPIVTPSSRKTRSNASEKHNEPAVTTTSRTRVQSRLVDSSDPPVVTRSSSRDKVVSDHDTAETKAPKTPSRRKAASEDDEMPPTVTRQSSRSKSQFKSRDQSTISENSNQTSVSRSKRKRTSSHTSQNESNLEKSPPKKTPSRRQRKTREPRDSVEDQPSVTRTGSRRRKESQVLLDEQPVVTRTGSKTRRRQASESSQDEPPIVTRTASRSKCQEISQAEPDAPPKSSSKRKSRKPKKPSEVQSASTVLTTLEQSQARSSSDCEDDSTQLESTITMETIFEAKELVTESTTHNLLTEKRSLHHHLRSHDAESKDGTRWSPTNEGINLIHISPHSLSETPLPKKRTSSSKTDDVTSRTTRSGNVIFPITSRRRAKIYTYDKEKKVFY